MQCSHNYLKIFLTFKNKVMTNFELESLTELNKEQLVDTFGGKQADGVAFGCAVAFVGVVTSVCGGAGLGLVAVGAGIIADAIF
jgi:hypothetical protein